MNLARALRLSPSAAVAFVGAGGKSTALFQLARELNPPVLVSATTHLGIWQIPLADKHYILKSRIDIDNILPSGVALVTGDIEKDRTKGLGNNAISWLREVSENNLLPLLIEADGSHQNPLKAPAEHEPPIPAFVDIVVQVAGLTGLGKPLNNETVHRPEIFAGLSGLKPGETITPSALARVLNHQKGGLKNIPENAYRVVLLNQADTPALQSKAESITKDLLSKYHSAIIASLKAGRIYAVHEPIAGIILAAGKAQRFGQPKQLLDWQGEPFVRALAKTALEAGLSPVSVVTGAYAEQVENAVRDLPIRIVYNEEWINGQASSIRAGLGPLPAQFRGWSWRSHFPASRPAAGDARDPARTGGRTCLYTGSHRCSHGARPTRQSGLVRPRHISRPDEARRRYRRARDILQTQGNLPALAR